MNRTSEPGSLFDSRRQIALKPKHKALEQSASVSERPEDSLILLTGRNQESDRFQGLRQGADEYITKPFPESELQAAVARPR